MWHPTKTFRIFIINIIKWGNEHTLIFHFNPADESQRDVKNQTIHERERAAPELNQNWTEPLLHVNRDVGHILNSPGAENTPASSQQRQSDGFRFRWGPSCSGADWCWWHVDPVLSSGRISAHLSGDHSTVSPRTHHMNWAWRYNIHKCCSWRWNVIVNWLRLIGWTPLLNWTNMAARLETFSSVTLQNVFLKTFCDTEMWHQVECRLIMSSRVTDSLHYLCRLRSVRKVQENFYDHLVCCWLLVAVCQDYSSPVCLLSY